MGAPHSNEEEPMKRSFLVRQNIRASGATLAAMCLAAACGGGAKNDTPDAGATADAAPVPVLRRASKASTVAITGDDRTVVMVNPEARSITIFDAVTQQPRASLTTGDEPSSVVIAPDDRTAFVANRASATVVKVTGLDGASPAVAASVDVGSEPTGLALSPTGATLYVAEFAESRVSVIDTATMAVTGTIAVDRPRAIAVTNNGDQSDADETIVVPSFYGEPIGTEATDASRQGRVHLYAASDLHETGSIVLAPRDSGFAPAAAGSGAPTVQASPNQLYMAGIAGTRVFIPSVSASPAPPIDFQANVQPIAYVIDLATGAEDTGALGTQNLAQLVRDNTDPATTRFFLADTVDVSFVGDSVAYYVSRGGDAIQRIQYTGAAPIVGSQRNKQIDLNLVPTGSTKACQNPTGIVVNHAGSFAYVNCWVTRQLGVVDLTLQALTKTVPSASITTDEADAQAGRRFYFTGRGRWSKNAWSDCGSCHPDGLSDNITWSFNSGPRETTSMDGTFSHHVGDVSQKQRVLNWTGIFDEIHDFERNTRAVSGGLGAVTTAGAGGCGDLTTEVRVNVDPNAATNPGGLSTPVKSIIASNTVCVHDWDKIEAWVKTIRPPRGRRSLDPASVARGAAIFGESDATHANAGCDQCHGGPGWTASRAFFAPDANTVSTLHTTAFTPQKDWGLTWSQAGNQIQQELVSTGRPPEQVACVLRNLGTFGASGLEQRLVNGTLVPAQGSLGYNIPSLYGLSLGAPYLHHGLAHTLAELFDNPTWLVHAEAGSPVWLHTGTDAEIAQRKADLVNFLLSIDATTAEQAIPAGFEGCPAGP
jgi:YVTN family beta-propeller protein